MRVRDARSVKMATQVIRSIKMVLVVFVSVLIIRPVASIPVTLSLPGVAVMMDTLEQNVSFVGLVILVMHQLTTVKVNYLIF